MRNRQAIPVITDEQLAVMLACTPRNARVTFGLSPEQTYTDTERAWFRSPIGAR